MFILFLRCFSTPLAINEKTLTLKYKIKRKKKLFLFSVNGSRKCLFEFLSSPTKIPEAYRFTCNESSSIYVGGNSRHVTTGNSEHQKKDPAVGQQLIEQFIEI